MNYLPGTILLVLLLSCNPRIHSAEDIYANGQKKYKGKYILCLSKDPTYPEIIIHEHRKFGKWTAYYPNGTIKEIRQYTQKVHDCHTDILKEGTWRYYNPEGILYLTQQYRHDSLAYAAIDVYEGESLIGKIIKSDFSSDSVFVKKAAHAGELIANASFDQYYFKPIQLINNGQDQIESLLPAWYSPDKATPDYYSIHRSVEGVPPHFKQQNTPETYNGYVGLMLYLDDENLSRHLLPDYSESLQTKLLEPLKKGRNYCFRINIRLSSNAGFSIDKFGVLFSKEPLVIDYTKPPDAVSISFTKELTNTADWETLCANYVASGGENYITIGRFSSRSNLKVNRRNATYKSSLDVNASAYYLVDHVELYSVSDSTACGCESPDAFVTNPDSIHPFTEEITVGDTIILENIHFKFDSYQLEQTSFNELNSLFRYLKTSPEIKLVIMGHTDSVGSEAYNLQLSIQRAEEVGKWLIDKGIKPERITTKGFGNRYPLLNSLSSSGLNRRVEITLTH